MIRLIRVEDGSGLLGFLSSPSAGAAAEEILHLIRSEFM